MDSENPLVHRNCSRPLALLNNRHLRIISQCARDGVHLNMSGKRLLDALALFKASRAVASQHLSIRLKQLDVYSKTSTLVKPLKKQIDPGAEATFSSAVRSTSSATGASSQQTHSSKSGPRAEQIPSLESVQDSDITKKDTEGLEQDHYYRPQDNSVADHVPNEDLSIQQEKAKRHPLPDGTIPGGETAIGTVKTDQDVYNQRSASEPVKNPLEQYESPSRSLEPLSSRRSSIPDPDMEISELPGLSLKSAKIMQQQSESQIPSKVAEPPGKKAYEVKGSPGDEGPELGVDHERDTFYRAPDRVSPVLSALPRVKLPKNMGNVQGGDSHIEENVNADVFYSSKSREQAAAASEHPLSQETEEPSQEMVNQIFRSPRVARLLANNGQLRSSKPKIGSSLRRNSTFSGERKDKDVFSQGVGAADIAPNSGSTKCEPAPSAKAEMNDMSKLAADIKEDVRAPTNVSENPTLHFHTMLIN